MANIIDTNIIREKLINLRGEKTRKEVACDLGLSPSAIAMYESGKRIPRDEYKVIIARYYGTTIEDIFFSSE